MRKLVGFLFILAGIAGGLYVGVWVLFIGGITDVIDGIKVTPTDGGLIAWGLAQTIILAEIIGTLIFFLGIGIGINILGYKPERLPSFRGSRG